MQLINSQVNRFVRKIYGNKSKELKLLSSPWKSKHVKVQLDMSETYLQEAPMACVPIWKSHTANIVYTNTRYLNHTEEIVKRNAFRCKTSICIFLPQVVLLI